MYEKQNRTEYILGIDPGNETSALAYCTETSLKPEILDISGGYGKPSVPTVIQYLQDSHEWIIGEDALLNSGVENAITVRDLISNLCSNQKVKIGEKLYSFPELLGIFLKRLIEQIRNINPRAKIKAIFATLAGNPSPETTEALANAFRLAGYANEYMGCVGNLECILYCLEDKESKALQIMDYGNRSFRRYLVNTERKDNVLIAKVSEEDTDRAISIENLNCSITAYLESFLTGKDYEVQKFKQFVHQNKDLLFQKHSKSVNLYYNFVYPPFRQKAEPEEVAKFLEPLRKKLTQTQPTGGSREIILCGGGFEMYLAKETVKNIYPDAKITSFKNAKCIFAEGALLYGLSKLKLTDKKIKILNPAQSREVGISIIQNNTPRFLPMITHDLKENTAHVIINQAGQTDINLDIFIKNHSSELEILKTLSLNGLPKRPKGTTRLSVDFKEAKDGEIWVRVKDLGFGDMFPRSDFESSFLLSVTENVRNKPGE